MTIHSFKIAATCRESSVSLASSELKRRTQHCKCHDNPPLHDNMSHCQLNHDHSCKLDCGKCEANDLMRLSCCPFGALRTPGWCGEFAAVRNMSQWQHELMTEHTQMTKLQAKVSKLKFPSESSQAKVSKLKFPLNFLLSGMGGAMVAHLISLDGYVTGWADNVRIRSLSYRILCGGLDKLIITGAGPHLCQMITFFN